MKCPCTKDCPRRSAECHSVCPEWLAYEQERNQQYKERYANKLLSNYFVARDISKKHDYCRKKRR